MTLAAFEDFDAASFRNLAAAIKRRYPRASFHDAEEAVQDAIARILSATERGKLDLSRSAGPLVYTVARWEIASALERRSRERLTEDVGRAIPDHSAESRPEARVLIKWAAGELTRCVRDTGLQDREISDQLGIRLYLVRRRRKAVGRDRRAGAIWDAELVTDAFRRYAEREGRTPREEDVTGNADMPSVETVRHYCGTWNRAIIAAGLLPERWTQLTPERVARLVLDFYERERRWPLFPDYKADPRLPDVGSVIAHLGTSDAGMIGRRVAAVLDIPEPFDPHAYRRGLGGRLDRGQVARVVAAWRERNGDWPGRLDIRSDPRLPTCQTLKRTFGTESAKRIGELLSV